MKKIIYAIVAIIMLAGTVTFLSCNKEGVDNATSEQVVLSDTKTVYPPIPSWARIDCAGNILLRKTLNYSSLCYDNLITGYFCGFEMTFPLANGPFSLYHGSGSPYGLQISNSYLTTNNLVALIDSAKHGYLTFHADIDILDTSMQTTVGFYQIPAGRYEAMQLGDSAIYVQF